MKTQKGSQLIEDINPMLEFATETYEIVKWVRTKLRGKILVDEAELREKIVPENLLNWMKTEVQADDTNDWSVSLLIRQFCKNEILGEKNE